MRWLLFLLWFRRSLWFCPGGGETVSAILAVALFVIATSPAGYGTFAIDTPDISAEDGSDIAWPGNDRVTLRRASESAQMNPEIGWERFEENGLACEGHMMLA